MKFIADVNGSNNIENLPNLFHEIEKWYWGKVDFI